MRFIVAAFTLFCVAVAPGTALGQGSSSNWNTCLVSPSGQNVSDNITVAGTGSQAGQTVTLSNVSVTFPTTLAEDAVIQAYNSGAFPGPGLNIISTDVTVRVDATNTLEGSRILSGLFNITVDIQDLDATPGTGDEFLAPLDATVPLPNSIWNPTDVNVEFTQTQFIAASGGTTIDCAPTFLPTPFEVVVVTPPPCNDAIDCNGNGTCDFWANCICNPGYGGADCACSDAIDCGGNGVCDVAGNCFCDPGYGGADCACSDAIDCSGNGICNFSGACICDAGYTGGDCATPTCIPEIDCNGNGACVAGECVCNSGYAAADCGTPICDPLVDCNGAPVAIGNLYTAIGNDGTATTLDGSTITWQNKEFPVFDQWAVNLGLAAGVNPMTVPPSGGFLLRADPTTTPASGTFEASFLSSSPGALEFYLIGDYVCPDNVGACGPQPGAPWYSPYKSNFVTTLAALSGAFVDSGPGTLPTTLGGAPVTYSVDGAGLCNWIIGASECTGTVYLNAFKGVSTVPGLESNVVVNQVYADPSDTSGQTLVPVNLTITYDEVVDTGTAAYTTVVASSQEAGTISSNFVIDSLGFSPVFLDITTTAQFNLDVTVCSSYPGTFANECDLRFLHNDDAAPDEFLDATLGEAHEDCPFPDIETTCANNLCINTVTNQICAGATSLSPWVVAEYVGNEAPIADAGLDQEAIIAIGTVVQLDGTGSCDLDGDAFTYAWTLSTPSGSAAALDDPGSATPSFVPDAYGNYVATLVVTDSNGLPSTPDDVLVSFDNVPPVADAGANQAVRVGDIVLLDGSASVDANGDSLTYEWSLVTAPVGSVATVNDPTAQTTTFTPDLSGTYQIDLIVSDGLADSAISSVTVVASTAEGELADTLENAIDVVNGLDPAVFKNRSLQKNMAKHIGQALAKVDQGKFNAARDKLEAVLRKTDGCANGGSPDPNDWIEDCAAQAQVHPLIVHAIALIDEILGQ